MVAGQDIQRVRYRQRDRLAIHYHQSYQVRRFAKTQAGLHARARRAAPIRSCTCSTSRSSTPRTATSASCSTSSDACAREGRLVFVCLHPTAAFQLEILREICERFLFVSGGACEAHPNFAALAATTNVRHYLGSLSP